MDTIDFGQLFIHLRHVLTPAQIIDRAGISDMTVDDVQAFFKYAQQLLDLHHEVCPELHTQQLLLIRK